MGRFAPGKRVVPRAASLFHWARQRLGARRGSTLATALASAAAGALAVNSLAQGGSFFSVTTLIAAVGPTGLTFPCWASLREPAPARFA